MQKNIIDPKISVILPTFNRAHLLERSINSVLAQTYKNIELIIIDDASEDDTPQLVNNFSDPRVVYIQHKTNMGANAARNTGINAAKGQFIAFQDSDDEWHKEKLEKQLSQFNSNNEIGAVFSAYIKIFPDNTIGQVSKKFTRKMWGEIYPQVLKYRWIDLPTLVVKRDLLQLTGNFDESLPILQDWDFIIRLAKYCNFGCVNDPLVNSYVSRGSISENENAALETIELIIKKYSEDFNKYPEAEAAQFVFIGNRKCLNGHMREGLNYFKKAIRVSPCSLPAWIGLILAYSGQNMYRKIIMLKRQFTH